MADGSFQNFLLGYNAGHALKQEREKQNALTLASKSAQAGDYKTGANALLGAGEYQGAGLLNQQADKERELQQAQQFGGQYQTDPQGAIGGAVASGNIPLASQLQGLDTAKIAQAKAHMEFGAQMNAALLNLPPEQRQGAALQALHGTPFDTPESQQAVQQQTDWSDQTLTAKAQQAMTVAQQFDQHLAQAKLVEDVRHNHATEDAKGATATRPATPEEVAAYGLPPGTAVAMGPNGPKVLTKQRQYTQDAAQAARLGKRMVLAEQELSGIDPKTIDWKEVWSVLNAGGWLGAGSPTTQKVLMSMRGFVNGINRKDSGAAIGKDEWDSARKLYYPVPGQDPATTEAKRRARLSEIEGMKAESQGAYGEFYEGKRAPVDGVDEDAGGAGVYNNSDVRTVRSKAEYDALPSGANYVDSQGTKGVKP